MFCDLDEEKEKIFWNSRGKNKTGVNFFLLYLKRNYFNAREHFWIIIFIIYFLAEK